MQKDLTFTTCFWEIIEASLSDHEVGWFITLLLALNRQAVRVTARRRAERAAVPDAEKLNGGVELLDPDAELVSGRTVRLRKASVRRKCAVSNRNRFRAFRKTSPW